MGSDGGVAGEIVRHYRDQLAHGAADLTGHVEKTAEATACCKEGGRRMRWGVRREENKFRRFTSKNLEMKAKQQLDERLELAEGELKN